MRAVATAARSRMTPFPVVAKRPQAGKALTVLLSVGCDLARDDVVDVAHRKPFDVDVPGPRVLETLDSVRREDQVEIVGAILELNEVLPANDLIFLFGCDVKCEFAERVHGRPSVFG